MTGEGVEFCDFIFIVQLRLPPPGKRDPFFGLSCGWYYKAAALGDIELVAVKLRGAQQGVRLVSYASVRNYIMRAMPNEMAG